MFLTRFLRRNDAMSSRVHLTKWVHVDRASKGADWKEEALTEASRLI